MTQEHNMSLSELASYGWFRFKGFVAWNIVRWFPLPLSLSPRNPIYRASARLWGCAYAADALPTFGDWKMHFSWPPVSALGGRSQGGEDA